MDFAQQQRNPAKHLIGMSIVVVLHVAVVYALMTGLARKVVEVIKQPLETKIIEEVKAPPLVDLPPPPSPPKFETPPPPYIPPPEVQVTPPPQPVQNTITQITSTPPPVAPPPVAPRVEAPPAPATAPAPAPVDVRVQCPNVVAVVSDLQGRFSRLAAKESIADPVEVTVEILLDAQGQIKESKVIQSTNRLVNGLAISGVRQLGCKAPGQETRVHVPFVFRLAE